MDNLLIIALSAAFLVVSLKRLDWGLLALIGIVIFFREGWYPGMAEAWTLYDMDIANIHVIEVLVSILIVSVVLKALYREIRIEIPSYTGIVLLFIGALFLAAIRGLQMGASFRAILGYAEWRALFWCLILFLLVPTILPTKERVQWLYNAMFVMAVARCLFGFWRYFAGDPVMHVTLHKKIVFWDAGENLFFSVFIVTTIARVMLNSGNRNHSGLWLHGLGSLLMAASVFLSLRRSFWVFVAASAALVVLLMPARKKSGLLIAGALGVSLMMGLFFSGVSGKKIDQLVHRATSFLSANADTNKFHRYDIYDAYLTIEKHIFTGVGFGNGFQRVRSRYGVGADNIPPNIVHNIYLHIWLKMGLLGIMVFLSFWLFYMYDCFRGARIREDEFLKSIKISQLAVVFGLLFMFIWGTLLVANTRAPLFIFIFLGMVPTVWSAEERRAVSGKKALVEGAAAPRTETAG